uniref:Uncharacterized protein n=1 Tax=Alexandrium catenella TaxID=2925 RepID=A0A7S1WJ41_ALECA|mmetsp:Transcript_65360/g.174167  ORF Transcript_65360/g.174167 Transcript_65360/m.174167 type:complete len:222 (+) Transcript_65360:100-765(+)
MAMRGAWTSGICRPSLRALLDWREGPRLGVLAEPGAWRPGSSASWLGRAAPRFEPRAVPARGRGTPATMLWMLILWSRHSSADAVMSRKETRREDEALEQREVLADRLSSDGNEEPEEKEPTTLCSGSFAAHRRCCERGRAEPDLGGRPLGASTARQRSAAEPTELAMLKVADASDEPAVAGDSLRPESDLLQQRNRASRPRGRNEPGFSGTRGGTALTCQ